jgi:hypothetical protein
MASADGAVHITAAKAAVTQANPACGLIID